MKNYARFLLELLCPLAFVFALVLSGNEWESAATKANRSHSKLDSNALVLPAENCMRQAETAGLSPEKQSLSRERLSTHTK